MDRVRRVSLLLLLGAAGCGLFGGGARRGDGSNPPPSTDAPESIPLRLVSHCAHAVDVCYSGTCVSLGGKPRQVRANTGGMEEVFVSFKGARDGIFVDRTFSTVEVDASCAKLDRKLGR